MSKLVFGMRDWTYARVLGMAALGYDPEDIAFECGQPRPKVLLALREAGKLPASHYARNIAALADAARQELNRPRQVRLPPVRLELQDPVSITAALFGDPPKGRSALDMKRAAEAAKGERP
ncbi:hypothetical protein [Roseibium litorale]|uniref:Uncharacterized protein n=1 Tax=Roseibium litorale TaxID=2803841 RepID=A0ABR9CIR0_9HYPH|nr:hypothetical protein [Roseibium litorale]MBD8890172.1 hypothetical protein [Roseibium litorale]